MRIAILTLPLHTNYGGILQAYALQTMLQRMGHEVDVVDKRWKPIPWKWYNRVHFYGKFVIRRMLKKKVSLGWRHPSVYSIITSQVKPFVDKYVHMREISSWIDIHEGEYDAIIVGSDQIWRPQYVSYCMGSAIEAAFLSFAQSWQVRRIAYAPSFGVDYWEYNEEQTSNCRELLQLFDAVSSREKSGVELCVSYLGRQSVQMLDPTMMLSISDYNELCKNVPQQRNTIFSYILDPSSLSQEVIHDMTILLDKRPIIANSRVDDQYAPIKERIQPAVENWLSGIRDADLVITDSFHACVFAIIYNKPFLVIGNEKRGAGRIISLLEQFGLETRYITDANGIDMKLCKESPNVDYSEWQRKSKSFLTQALA